ncbi:MAG TPA: site-2 protease family protein [Thermodesulfobacteriota bacterium]|jgi:Zn-dependent protease
MFDEINLFGVAIIFGCILLSVVLHEMTHGLVARRLGDDTAFEHGRISLNPLKHIDIFTTVLLPLGMILLGLPPFFIAKPVPVDFRSLRYGEYGMALVGISGPLSNLALASLGSVLLHITGAMNQAGLLTNTLLYFTQINVALFVFNMIPFPPLDGSRVLYAFSPDIVRSILLRIESYGLMSILLFIIIVFPFLREFVQEVTLIILKLLLVPV